MPVSRSNNSQSIHKRTLVDAADRWTMCNVEGRHGTLERFQWEKSPTGDELARLSHTIARGVGRLLECLGLIEGDAEHDYLGLESRGDDSMHHLRWHSITYRIAVGPQTGRKVFTPQTLPACAPDDPLADTVGKTAGFSMPAGLFG